MPPIRCPSENGVATEAGSGEILGPVRLRVPTGGEWSFFGMFASFDTPFEVTTSELAIELLFPADRATAEALGKGAPRPRSTPDSDAYSPAAAGLY